MSKFSKFDVNFYLRIICYNVLEREVTKLEQMISQEHTSLRIMYKLTNVNDYIFLVCYRLQY